VAQPHATTNKQTTAFCAKLGILDPMALLIGRWVGGGLGVAHKITIGKKFLPSAEFLRRNGAKFLFKSNHAYSSAKYFVKHCSPEYPLKTNVKIIGLNFSNSFQI
jgi:hypothetical protein